MKSIIKTCTVITAIFVCIFLVVGYFLKDGYNQKMYHNAYEKVDTDYETAVQEYKEYIEKSTLSVADYNSSAIKKLHLGAKVPCTVTVSYDLKESKGNIGNDMVYEAFVNGTSIKKNEEKTVDIQLLKSNNIAAKIIERDPSSDDVGRHEEDIAIPISDLVKGKTIRFDVKVSEHYGKQAGSYDIYTVTVHIKSNDYYSVPSYKPLPVVKEPIKADRPSKSDFQYSIAEVISRDTKSQIVCAVVACIYLYSIVCNIKQCLEEEKQRKIEEEKRKQKELEEARLAEQQKQEFLTKYKGKSLREVAHVPSNITFDKTGLPRDNNDSLYGSFTVYLSKNGKKYHKVAGCYSASIPRHLFTIRGYTQCSRCWPPSNKHPQWYTDYKALVKQAQKYNIETDIVP